jgi:hypothetical protein
LAWAIVPSIGGLVTVDCAALGEPPDLPDAFDFGERENLDDLAELAAALARLARLAELAGFIDCPRSERFFLAD